MCLICKKEINIEKELSKCKNDIEKTIVKNKNFHVECYRKINSNFNKKQIQKRIYFHECPKCKNKELTLSYMWKCKCGWKTINERKYKHICSNCKFEEITNSVNWTCPKCKNKEFKVDFTKRIYKHKCLNTNCGFEESNSTPNNRWTCPKCGNRPEIQKIYHICKNCGFEEYSECPNSTWVCKKCGLSNHIYKHKCLNTNCGFEESNSTPNNRWTCPKCGNRPEIQKCKHICPICSNSEETIGTKWKCSKCGWTNYQKNIFHHICECGYEEDNECPISSWICPKCGNVKFRNFSKKIKCNKKCKFYKNCNNKDCLKNEYGFCEKGMNYIGLIDREKFYRTKLNLIAFESLDNEIKIEDFDNLYNKIGV